MKNAFTILYLICISLFPTSLPKRDCCDLSPSEALQRGRCDQAYRDGVQAGAALQQDRIWQEGYDACLEENKQHWIDYAMARILERYRNAHTDSVMLLILSNMEKSNDTVSAHQRGYNAGKAYGIKLSQKDTFAQGYRQGFHMAFDSTYNYRLQRGQLLQAPPRKDILFTTHYEKIVDLLQAMDGKQRHVERAHFDDALLTIHTDILASLVEIFQESLTVSEQIEIFQRYNEIHPQLAALYYDKYLERCRDFPFENDLLTDMSHYQSVDFFLDVFLPGVCSVVDVVFTYAKGSPYYTAGAGFEVMGTMAEFITEHLLICLQEHFHKIAFLKDIERKMDKIEDQLRKILTPLVVDTWIDRLPLTKTVEVRKGTSVTVEMDIQTIVNIGLPVENLNLTVDHQKRVFNLSIPADPRIIELVQQDFRVINVRQEGQKATRPGAVAQLTGSLDGEDLVVGKTHFNKIFKANQPNLKDLRIMENSLERKNLNAVLPTLIKTFEPLVRAGRNGYEVRVHFGHRGRFYLLKRS